MSVQLEITYTKVDHLIPYVNNAKLHEESQINAIASSIKEFGFNDPIGVDGDNGIIEGHGRVLAAQKLGLETVPTIELSHLSEAQKKAYILAHNRLGEIGTGWDMDLVRLELQELDDLDFDIDLTGFGDVDFSEMTEGLTDEDAVPQVEENPVSKLGDLWVLGNHRLLCGDSTMVDDTDKLMRDDRVDMVFTDPPYNIDYQGVKNKQGKIINDKMDDSQFVQFLKDSLLGCETMYVCCSWEKANLFKQAMTDIARAPKAMIVWNKVNPAQHLDKYFKQHEIIFYYGDFGGHTTVRGDIWELKRQRNTLHPTMKPVELIEMALLDQPGKKVIYDGFGGSGSTVIACEKSARHARVMELDPKYCDVIIKRWQEFTGKQAIHSESEKSFNELKSLSGGKEET